MTDCFTEIANAPWQPVDYLPYLKEMHEVWTAAVGVLRKKAKSKAGHNWRHHLPQILDNIHSLCELIRAEIDNYGEWRDDDLQMDEVIQLIDEDSIETIYWVRRMTGIEPPEF